MTSSLGILMLSSVFALTGGFTVLAYVLATASPVSRPELGNRGLKRHQALARGGVFAVFEPGLRFVAGWIAELPIDGLRRRIDREIERAGDYLGLCADELLGLCLSSATGLGSISLLFGRLLDLPAAAAYCGFLLGGLLPWFRLTNAASGRGKRVNLCLPATVDLAALCMGAGLDFPGSIRQIVQSAPDQSEPVIEELARVLRELELGYSRQRALEGFADRVPTALVREFVNSVVQSEQKGSPLVEVLRVQAETQRTKRSVAAEESASGAALMLMGPMTLIFVCVITLMLGPVLVRAASGGFG